MGRGRALGFLPEGYADGAMITIIIALGALVNMATGVNHPILINSDRYIYGSVFMVTLLVATLIGNLILVPRFGALGAAISSCLASIVYNGLKFEFIRRHYRMQPFDRASLWIVMIIGASWATLEWIDLPLPPLLRILLRSSAAIGLYSAALTMFRLWDGWLDQLPLPWVRSR